MSVWKYVQQLSRARITKFSLRITTFSLCFAFSLVLLFQFSLNFVSFFLIACHCKIKENIIGLKLFFSKGRILTRHQLTLEVIFKQSTVDLSKQVRIIFLSCQFERMTNASRYLKSQSILNASHCFSLHYITHLFTLQALWGSDFVPFCVSTMPSTIGHRT